MKKAVFVCFFGLGSVLLPRAEVFASETKPSAQVDLFNQFKTCIKMSVAEAKAANSPFLFDAVCQSERIALQSNMAIEDFSQLQSALKTMSEQLLSQ
ncbi:hypothetical protein FJ444_14355 [Aestuariibacter sp. GS-14]|uniref:hypothetical protein n=1 Tax=Alteromonadaceae TaxID=72275 RepID=UPI00112DB1BC|nr:hypothetical protein [Aestuariibacter sp. GS-14]TPV56930.1 hypothetical protein FJ444_14355 [Aestuariibacter sp. GS-14]